MLIVCPSCTTSYTIDPASVGAAGRAVRCARCKTTWFAQPQKQETEVDAFVESVIAEAESQTAGGAAANVGEAADAGFGSGPAPDDFGAEMPEPAAQQAAPSDGTASQTQPERYETDAAPQLDIAEAPSLVPSIDPAPLPAPADAIGGTDVETFATRRARLRNRRQGKRRSSRWTAVILVLLACNVAIVMARTEVVRYLPQTASLFSAIGLPVNLRHLKFEGVKISREDQDGVEILIVDGTIVSAAERAVEVPRLRFAARNAGGQEIFTWSALPDRSILGAGESLKFTSRLASPPPDAADVLVRFFNAQDVGPGKR
jgi:predicted Zn finger-like uncharacterized protein